MALNFDGILSRYQQLLRRYSRSSRMIQWGETAKELDSLAKYAISVDDKATRESFEELVIEEFRPSSFVSSRLFESYKDFVNLYKGFHLKLLYLKSHIGDKSLKACELQYLSVVIDVLPSFLHECCDDYVFRRRDCFYDGICIFECIMYYESSIKERARLRGFDKDLICRVKKFTKEEETDFDRIYLVWKRAEDFLKLFNSNLLLYSSPASLLLTNDRSSLIIKTLERYILSPETALSVFSDEERARYYSSKEFYWEQDFDLLLAQIILVDDFRCTRLDKRPELRNKFHGSLPNIHDFHVELFNYMYDRFHKNYTLIRKNPSKISFKLEEKWINAFSTLLICYLPALEDFIHLVLRKLLLPQILELGSTKFKKFYQHTFCLERYVFENLCRTSPNAVLELRETIDLLLELPTNANRLNSNGPIFEKFFMPSKNATIFDLLPEREPVWPDQSFKEHWNKQLKLYSSQGKSLHGCFSKHRIVMKLPISCRGSDRVTLVTNLPIASILSLFNDYPTLTFQGICQRLNAAKANEYTLWQSLEKLLNFRLIVRIKHNIYKFNYEFKESNPPGKFLKLI